MPDTFYLENQYDTIDERDLNYGLVDVPVVYKQQEEDNNYIDSFIIFAFILFIAANSIFKKRIKHFLLKKGLLTGTIYHPTPTAVQPNYLVYSGKNLAFSTQELDTILNKYHPYYKQLNPLLKNTFIERLKSFMAKKLFIIHAKEGYKEMPILLSAAAIQITFGLDHYLLPYFKYLQIHPQEYYAANSFRILAGDVTSNSITVAFNHLLEGYEDYTSGSNVGLHEMAHALYYQEIIINNTPEDSFDYFFHKIMDEGQEVYNQKHLNTLFSSYAFKELQEFWAESVELFFERPTDLQTHFPELFTLMKKLLNQYPQNASNPIHIQD